VADYIDVIGGVTEDSAYKPPARLAATADLGTGLIGLLVIDGVQTVAGDRILLWKQADQTTNGIYTVSTAAWSRSIDFSSSSAILRGTQVYVSDGSSYAKATFICQTENPVVGTTPITFLQAPSGGGSSGPTIQPSRYIVSGSTDTATAADGFIGWASASGAAKTELIPAASTLTAGQQLTISDSFYDAGLNPITITPAAGTIAGQPSAVINKPGGSLTLHANPASNNYDLV